ncbi:MAG: thioredoxin family protein [Hydrogenibacillus schlegelii]|nr:thioredoxin family protein [Hydrogenibacillus schlegelii]
MGIIAEKDKETIRDWFGQMTEPVHVVFFWSEAENKEYGEATKQILEELAALTDKLHLQVYRLDDPASGDVAARYGVDKAPAIVFTRENGEDTGVRFYGIPSGYEFTTLIEDIVDLGKGTHGLSQQTVEKLLAEVDKDVHIQVFVTPTCPYCPRAVRIAHFMAMVHPKIRADMVEATEFPELANQYNVYGVPKTVINDVEEQEGAVPEQVILQKVLAAIR